MNKIAFGIFSWPPSERRTNRYGAFFAIDTPHGGSVTEKCDSSGAAPFEGKRVKLTVRVIRTRTSGHCGDFSLKVFPSTPQVDQEFVLGIGILRVEPAVEDAPLLVLTPEDGREELWLDPRILYQLHDQSVEVYAEETTEPAHTVEPFVEADKEGAFSTGDALQVKTKRKNVQVKPNLESLGGGTFILTPPGGPVGTKFEVDSLRGTK